jgi:hypothetical protein
MGMKLKHWTPVTCYLLSNGNLIVNPVQFMFTGNIKKGNQGMIQNINVDRLI